MLFVWIGLWVLAVVLKVTNDNIEMKWIASLCFFSGMAGLNAILKDNILPAISMNGLKVFVSHIVSVTLFLTYTMAPYSMGVCSAVSSKWLEEKAPFFYRHSSKFLLILPILMLVLYPPFGRVYKAPFFVLSLWVVPGCILSNLLLFITYVKETRIRIKQQRLLIFFLLAPPTMYSAISNFALRAAGIHDMWEYNSYTVFGIMLIFMLGSVKFGAFGIKLRFEKYRLESAMRIYTSGTAILNHTIKNEIMKISICADNIKHYLKNSNDIGYVRKSTQEDLELIELSSVHALNMMKKTHEHLMNINVNETSNYLNEQVEQALLMVKPYLEDKEIIVKKSYEIEAKLMCDPLHVKEVIINIFKNSIEAMDIGGCLSINIYKDRKWLTISVNDNGSGIEKDNLSYVLEPFFSTKNTDTNYGLGLSYCYNVMQQHGGNLEISSGKNSGTTVSLNFRSSKALSAAGIDFFEEVEYGKNKGFAC